METRDILEKDFYNGVQAAQKLGVNKSRIYALAAQGRFEGAFKAWDSWLIPKLSVDNLLTIDGLATLSTKFHNG